MAVPRWTPVWPFHSTRIMAAFLYGTQALRHGIPGYRLDYAVADNTTVIGGSGHSADDVIGLTYCHTMFYVFRILSDQGVKQEPRMG